MTLNETLEQLKALGNAKAICPWALLRPRVGMIFHYSRASRACPPGSDVFGRACRRFGRLRSATWRSVRFHLAPEIVGDGGESNPVVGAVGRGAGHRSGLGSHA
jgi:hypothetical protein